MSAKVSPTPTAQFKFRAWCDDCQIGLNTHTKLPALEWANAHNYKHPAAKGTK